MKILHVFWWSDDKQQAGVLVDDGSSQWADIYAFDELFSRFADGTDTRHQFREDIRGQAQVCIQDGEAHFAAHP